MKARIISLLLCIAVICTILTACNEAAPQISETDSQAETSAEQSDDNSQEESSEPEDFFADGLPDVNYNGKEFIILQRTEYQYEFCEDESATEKVNELIKERNQNVEQRFGVKIKTIEQDGAWGKHEDFITFIRNTVNGNSADYHLISGYAAITPTLISEDLFVNWYELDDYINFEKPWWSQDFIDEMTVNNRLYLLSGDISLTFWESMQCMFFNKDLAEDYHYDNLYQTVRDGDWTFDYMKEVIKDTYKPVDDTDSRVYSYATAYTTQIDVYQDAFDIPVTTKDGQGKPYFTINQSKTYDALDMIFDLLVDQPYVKVCTDQLDTARFFGQGKALFAPLYLSNGTLLQSYENLNYGILPMPKFDKAQEDYHTTCTDFYSVFAIPITACDDLDFIGIVTEGLCVESSRSVVPEYYNLVLKERNTSDDDSIEMIETIRKGILCNFGYLYSYTLNWPAHQLNICINNKIASFASNWESKEGAFNENLKKAIAYYFDE